MSGPLVLFQRRSTANNGGPRNRLRGATQFYVNDAIGSDSNTGRSSGAAKKTIQAMINDLKQNYDLGGFLPTVNVADGTYTAPIDIDAPFVGEGAWPPIEFIGNTAHPENVLISVTGVALSLNGAAARFAGFKWTTVGGNIWQTHSYSYLEHHDNWLASSGQDAIECSGDSIVVATGPTTVSGIGADFSHYTDGGQIIWEDQTINLVDDATGLPGTRITGPKYVNYIAGGNRATCSFGRATIIGSFGCDAGHLSRLFTHISATLNLSSTVNIEAFFPGQTAPRTEAGGKVIYDQGIGDTIYCRLDAIGNNGDGYADNATRAFLNPTFAMLALAARAPDPIFAAIPTIKIGPGTWSAIRPIDIPGVAEVILLGDETTPSNCTISTTSANCVELLGSQTKWHIRGFKFVSSAGGAIATPPGGSKIAYQNCDFGACGLAHIQLTASSYIEDTGPWILSGGGPGFLTAAAADCRITKAVTVVGSPAYSDVGVRATEGARLRITTTFTGVTGTRCDISNGAVVNHNTGTQVGLPGSVDGNVDAGTFGLLI